MPVQLIAAPFVVAVGLLLGFGVELGEPIRYGLFELFFAALPGILLFGALTGWRGSRLTAIAVGWSLGYVLELLFFNLTAAIDLRELLWIYPLLFLAALGPNAYRFWSSRRSDSLQSDSWADPASRWGAALGAISLSVGFIYLALGEFSAVELARDAQSATYFQDVSYHLSIAAEALHHWPIENPSVAGESLRYHTFAHMHAAAGAQITGLELEVVLNRFFGIFQLGLLSLQIFVLGRWVGRRAIVGGVAVALMLVAGELDLDPDRVAPFLGQFLRSFMLSPSFAFGLSFLGALAILLWERIEIGERSRGSLVVMVLLVIGASGAKAAVIPVAFGGLTAVFVYQRWVTPKAASGIGRDIAIVSVVFVAMYGLLYAGGGSSGLTIDPLRILGASIGEFFIGFSDPGPGGLVLWAAFTPLGLLAALTPVIAAGFVVVRRGRNLGPGRVFALGGFLAGMVATFAFGHPAGGQLYFGMYGYLLLIPVAAEGIVLAVESIAPERRRSLAIGTAIGLAGAVAMSIIGWTVSDRPGVNYAVAYGGLGLLALGSILVLVRRRGRAIGAPSIALPFLAVFFVSASAIDAPLDWASDPIQRIAEGQSAYAPSALGSLHGLDRDLYEGLRWVRANSDPDELIAVNNHWAEDTDTVPVFFYYSAFAERRVLIESWLYSPPSYELGYGLVQQGLATPYAELVELNDAAFDGRPAALAGLAEKGVDLLLVDRLNGDAQELPDPARPVFSNSALAVYRLGAGV